MDQLTYVFFVFVLGAVVMWIFIKSPTLQHFFKIFYLVAWLLISTVMPIYAIFVFHLPKERYIEAVFSVLFAVAMTFFWWNIAKAELLHSLKKNLKSIPWWENY